MSSRLGPAARGAVGLVIGFAALFSVIGGDARWLGALGADIVRTGGIPHGVPFASAPSGSWPNVPALSELVFHGLFIVGGRALLAAQLAAVVVAFVVMARDARAAGARDGAIALVLLVAAIGAFPAFAIVRVQLFSVALFPVLLALLRRETRHESRRIWLVVPLFALWSNLHGAVLVGLVVLFVYLALSRARRSPVESAGIAVAAALACCLTPGLDQTPRYFHGVLENEAARRGIGFWAPLSISHPYDVVLAAAALLLLALAVRSRPSLWEVVALLVLAGATVNASRSGVWLVLAVAPLAATALSGVREASARLTRLALIAGAATAVIGLAKGPGSTAASASLVERAVAAAKGTPILAEDVLAEQVALHGGRIEIGNPVDAFSRRDQAAYLDWIGGRREGDGDLAAARVVLVVRHGRAERRVARDGRFRRVAVDKIAALFVRRGAARG